MNLICGFFLKNVHEYSTRIKKIYFKKTLLLIILYDFIKLITFIFHTVV
jgi:hypothetical protein